MGVGVDPAENLLSQVPGSHWLRETGSGKEEKRTFDNAIEGICGFYILSMLALHFAATF
jgi:hypothetical protein